MALVFVPKVLFIRQHAHDPREKEEDEWKNREKEREHMQVKKENEDLQKEISEVCNRNREDTSRVGGRTKA